MRFNCELVDISFSAVCAGVLQKKAIASTRMVEMQCLTNSVALADGEELLLRVLPPCPKKKAAAKRTWMDARRENQKNQKKEESTQKAKVPKTIDGLALAV